MSNKKVCATRVNVNGVLFDFRRHAFFMVAPDGSGGACVKRIRHYRDMLDIHEAAFDEGLGAVIAVVKKSDEVSLDDVARAISEFASDPFSGSSDGRVHVGTTTDYRRAQIPTGRVRTGTGGLGHVRTPERELTMLLHSDRSADAAYESAADRSARRRALVADLASRDRQALDDVLAEVKKNSSLRVPAIMLAVDAAVAGAEDAISLLSRVLVRPDDPALALQYFYETYGTELKPPAALKRALGVAASTMYDERTCIRFDVRRNRAVEDRSQKGRPVDFADVIRVCRPKPRDEAQSRLFAAVLSGYEEVSGLPLLETRARLRSLPLEQARAEINAAAERVAAGAVDEPLTQLTWRELVSILAAPRTDVRNAVEELESARAALAGIKTRHADAIAQERRLRHRLRDAKDKVTKFNVFGFSSEDQDPVDARIGRTAALESVAAAQKTLREFRATPAAREMAADLSVGRRNVEKADVECRRLQRSPGVVDPAILRLTAPRMGTTEILSMLGAIDRAGVSTELLPVVAARLEKGASFPDLMRAARGVALAAQSVDADTTAGYGARPSWVSTAPSVWEPTLESAMTDAVARKLPAVQGRVLILVDGSGSMGMQVSGRANDQRAEGYASLSCAEVASFAAAAIASRCQVTPDVYVYDTKAIKVDPGSGVLAAARSIARDIPGGGTDTFSVLANTFKDHDLVVVLTDEQTGYVPRRISSRGPSPTPEFPVPGDTPMVTVNLAGHRAAHAAESGSHTTISGWSEALFDHIAQVAG